MSLLISAWQFLNTKLDKILKLLTPSTVEVAPLESDIDEKVIDEIAEEGIEVKPEAKEKKAKSKTKKPATKTKKTPPAKN